MPEIREAVSGRITTPWRGSEFPDNPIPEQLFYLSVDNDVTPSRGWYIWRTNFSGLPKPHWEKLDQVNV